MSITNAFRSFITFIAAAAVGSCFACSSAGPNPTPDRKPHAPAQAASVSKQLTGLSVAILNKEPPFEDVIFKRVPANGAICTGTWVGRDEILTAFHCVVGATGQPDEFETRRFEATIGKLDIRGMTVRFALPIDVDDDEEDTDSIMSVHTARVDRYNVDDDLAIIKTVDIVASQWARITDRPIELAERVQGVVQTAGFPFSWAEGYVSRARRSIIVNQYSRKKTTAFQVASDMWNGSSGACVFDDELRCMGVFVATFKGHSMIGFVIDHERVRSLLVRKSDDKPRNMPQTLKP